MHRLSPESKTRRSLSRLVATILLAAAFGVPLGASSAAEDIVGRMGTYRTVYDDTLHEVARRFDLGFVELVAANPGVDPWLPGDGTEIVLPTAHLLPFAPREGIVINLAEMRLYAFIRPDAPPETYPIAIGREGKDTPLGDTRIVRKATDPTWYPTDSIRAERPELPAVVPPGPDNPLGSHALYLGWPAYLIHGTNRPWGIGRQASSGCLRMYPEDIERLYRDVPVGTPVTVVHQQVKAGWMDGELFMEVHPSDAEAAQIEIDGTFEPGNPGEILTNAVAIVRAAAGAQADRLDLDAVVRVALERRGYPIRVTR